MKGASPALMAHVAQAAAARFLTAAFLVAALVAGLIWGKGPALALALVAGAFYLARPGPSEALDKETGRGQ